MCLRVPVNLQISYKFSVEYEDGFCQEPNERLIDYSGCDRKIQVRIEILLKAVAAALYRAPLPVNWCQALQLLAH